jgi:hypothetical protein
MTTRTKPKGTATIVFTDGKSQTTAAALREAILMGQSDRCQLVPSVSLGHIHPAVFHAGHEYTLPPIEHASLADRAGVGHVHALVEQTAATDVHIAEGSLSNMSGGNVTNAESVRAALEPLALETGTNIVLTVTAQPKADEPHTPEPVDPYVAHCLERGSCMQLTAEQAHQVNGLLAAMATTTPALRIWDGHPVTPGTAVIVGSPGRYSGRLLATVYDQTGRASERYWDVSRDALTAYQFTESLLSEKAAQVLLIEADLGKYDARLTIDLEALAAEHDIAVAVL